MLGRLWVCLLSMVSIVTAFDAAQLKQMRNAKGVIRVNDATFDQVVEGPRDYTVAVLLTAEGPQFGCGFCKIFGPAFETLAYSWKYDHPSGDGLYFVLADLTENKQAYAKLELTHAPSFFVYPPTNKTTSIAQNNGDYESYVFPQVETQVPQLKAFLETRLGVGINIHEPFQWGRFALSCGTAFAVVAILKVFWQRVLKVLQSKQLWTAVTLVCILMFTAGHMFNMIRKTPYIVGDGHGGATYFVEGHSNQIAVETQIVALVYAILSFCVISLVVKVPRITNPHSQTLATYALVAVSFVAFSFLMAKFKVKNGGYPFGLLNIF